MTDLVQMATEITAELDLGDHIYPDVHTIVRGKLTDRYDKLIGKKTRKEGVITEERIRNTVHSVVADFLESSQELVSGTADYYRKKYDIPGPTIEAN